jgi:ribosome-associated toxin RatA of RatAB toxin-antitoxin module
MLTRNEFRMEESSDANEPENSLKRHRITWLVALGAVLVAGSALAGSALSSDSDSAPGAPTGSLGLSGSSGAAVVSPLSKSAEGHAASERKAKRYRVKVAGSSVDRGGAKIQVAAPSALVTEIVQNFGDYASFIPQFRKSEVVKRDGDFTDVRIEVPVLGGLTTFWAIVRFGPPEPLSKAKSGDAKAKSAAPQRIRGRFVKGNLKSLDVAWLVHPTGNAGTRLHLEIHMVPKLPVPGSVVSGELESAADKGVTAARDRVERLARERKAR